MSDDLPPANDGQPADAEHILAWQLRVLGGLHRGATVDLDPDAWLLIGSGADCDVVLRDAGVMAHHAVLFHRDGQRWLRAMEGSVTVGERELAVGDSVALASVTLCRLAGVAVGLGEVAAPQWLQLIDECRAAQADKAVEPETPTHDEAPEHGAQMEMPPAGDAAPTIGKIVWWRRARLGRAIGVLATCSLTLFICVAGWMLLTHDSQARVGFKSVRETVAALGLAEVRVTEAPNGMVQVEGTVRNETERSRLLQELNARGLHPAVSVVSGEHLAQTVQDSFRMRGMPVKASYGGAGKIDVAGVSPSPQTEQAIREMLGGGGAVKQIVLTDTAPRPPSASTSATEGVEVVQLAATAPANGARDPKRVIGVVSGTERYVVTQDGTRYLAGALLPDGSQVAEIDGHTVVFLRNGNRVPVEF